MVLIIVAMTYDVLMFAFSSNVGVVKGLVRIRDSNEFKLLLALSFVANTFK